MEESGRIDDADGYVQLIEHLTIPYIPYRLKQTPRVYTILFGRLQLYHPYLKTVIQHPSWLKRIMRSHIDSF